MTFTFYEFATWAILAPVATFALGLWLGSREREKCRVAVLAVVLEMTLREKIEKLLGWYTRFYCPSCDQVWRIWGAKRKINYFCQDCPSELLKDKK